MVGMLCLFPFLSPLPSRDAFLARPPSIVPFELNAFTPHACCEEIEDIECPRKPTFTRPSTGSYQCHSVHHETPLISAQWNK